MNVKSTGYLAYHDDVAIQIFSNINITFHDGVEGCDMNAAALKAQDAWLEESLWSTETLVANSDDLAIRKLVGFLQARALGCGLDFLLKVKCDIAELLLDIADNFALGGGGKGISALSQNFHQVICQIAAGHINTRDSVRQCETLVDWDNVSNSIAGVEDNTSSTTGSVEGKDGLDGDVEGWSVEGLENNLCHLLAIRFRVDGCLSKQDWVLLGSNTQLVIECMMPDFFHIVPVGDNTVLDWVSQSKNTTL